MDNMNNQDSTDLELRNEIDLGNALEILKTKEEFDKVITQSYFRDKVDENVAKLCDVETRSKAFEELVAISHLMRHFLTIKNTADGSIDNL